MHCSRTEYAMRKRWLVKGFTMVEIMIVVLIMGIITVVGVPLLTTSMDHYRLKGAAQEVVNALQYAQAIAMTSGKETLVRITPVLETISVSHYETTADLSGGGNQLAAANVEGGSYTYMEHPLKKGVDYVITLTAEDRFNGVHIIWSDFNQLLPLYFNTVGRPSHGGTVILTLKGEQMVVTVDALTGKIAVVAGSSPQRRKGRGEKQ